MLTDKNRKRLVEIRMQQADLETERLLKMSDAEVMAEAVREYGSPQAVERVVNKMKQSVKHIISRTRKEAKE